MGITGDTWEEEALKADCGILPASLTGTVELATLHTHLITVEKRRRPATTRRQSSLKPSGDKKKTLDTHR
jgi:hypothetical protein